MPVNIGTGEQFKPDFLKISPNNRMPAIVDHEPPGGGDPVSVFESGAILQYLAEKAGKFLPKDLRGKYEVLQWVNWQMGGLGPMAGQANHFNMYAPQFNPPEQLTYGQRPLQQRGQPPVRRARTSGSPTASSSPATYSIADMASWPWVVGFKNFGQKLEDFPALQKWFDARAARCAGRAAVLRATGSAH